jgi:hypothetical protein
MIKHIVMWNVLGSNADERRHNIERLRHAFEASGTGPASFTEIALR